MGLKEQLENTPLLEGYDLTSKKFSEVLDAYLAHLAHGPSPLDFGGRSWEEHAQTLRDEMDRRIDGVSA